MADVKNGFRLRFRHGYMTIGSFLVILLWLFTDPDNNIISHLPFGASTVATIAILLKSILYVTVLHLSRKALMDYLDLKTVFEKAMQTSEGAGQVFIGVGLVFLAIAVTIYAAVRF
jgi:hypothetical protein